MKESKVLEANVKQRDFRLFFDLGLDVVFYEVANEEGRSVTSQINFLIREYIAKNHPEKVLPAIQPPKKREYKGKRRQAKDVPRFATN